MNKLPVSILRSVRFRHADMSSALLEMRTNGQKWSVARYLPAGMDIGPDHWTWNTLEKAENHFASLTEHLTGLGFKVDESVDSLSQAAKL